MAEKYLFELTVSELKTELERVGISGLNSESEAVIKLTIYLVSVGEDPFIFKFKPFDKTGTDDVPSEVEENIEGGPKYDCEVMIVLGQLPVANDVAGNAKVDQNVEIEASEDMPVTAVDAFQEVREGNVVPFNASEDKFVDAILSVSVDLPRVEIEEQDNVTKVAVFASDIDDTIDSVNSTIEAVFGTRSIDISLTTFMSSSTGVLKLFWIKETELEVAWDSCIFEDMISWPPDSPILSQCRDVANC